MSLPSLLVNQSGCNKTILGAGHAGTNSTSKGSATHGRTWPSPIPGSTTHAHMHACKLRASYCKEISIQLNTLKAPDSIACVCYEVGRPCQACCGAMPAVGSDRCWCSLASQGALSTAVFM